MGVLSIAKNLGMEHNVTFRVLDEATGKVVSEHIGHNRATNSMLIGIANYLKGDGVLNQGYSMLSNNLPKYISLGTMGLINQDEDKDGLPVGIGVSETNEQGVLLSEAERFNDYMIQAPGFGADGYDSTRNNNRIYSGLGPKFANRDSNKTVRCELISETFPRAQITYRSVLPEYQAELPETIDIVYSAMISTGALAQFREPGKDYVFITEAGLWSKPTWNDVGANGLLAGYRIIPPNVENHTMMPSDTVSNEQAAKNREILKKQIIKVRTNQVVQVIWKIQIGAVSQFNTRPEIIYESLYWKEVL